MNARNSGKPEIDSWITLQSITLTQQGVCTETELFYRLKGDAFISETSGEVSLEPGAAIRFDTFSNMVSIGTWSGLGAINGLELRLRGRGRVELSVFQAVSVQSSERFICEVVALSETEEARIDLSGFEFNEAPGMIWLEVRARGPEADAVLMSARFVTKAPAENPVRLAICLPEAPKNGLALARLLDWCGLANTAGQARVLVAGKPGDFAASAFLDSFPEVKTGFAGVLQCARASGFSHALLLAPDVSVAAETLNRVLAFATLVTDPNAALGAAVFDPSERGLLSENGTIANDADRAMALFAGLDLRDRNTVLEMAVEQAGLAQGAVIAHTEFVVVALAALPAVISEDSFRHIASNESLTTARIPVLALEKLHVHQLAGVVIKRPKAAPSLPDLITLQNMIFPEAGLCTEQAMYFHFAGTASYNEKPHQVVLEPGATALFDSFFNALSIGKWHRSCKLDGLYLGVQGHGRATIRVFHAIPDRSWELLVSRNVTLSKDHETMFDLSHYSKIATNGVIYFEVQAIGSGVLVTSARFMTRGKPAPTRQLALSITTFKREELVENTARRLLKYLETAEFRDHLHVFIIDNGDSAKIPEHPQLTRLANRNYGGAGGFARGLIEAEAAGYSHVLFMDDDASIPMEALHRTYAFLTLSKDPKVAIAGAMINTTDKWRMWENGAVFDRRCMPLFTGVDLRNRDGMLNIEFTSQLDRPAKMYGGWWFFAFPVCQVARHPFPFFVRGDDVNFSLVNDFHITTLNGVVSFADDFTDKESPLTWYLDLRSHMVHHLTIEKMDVGRFQVAMIGIWFFLRNIAKFQYETIEAVLMAWRDVMRGPDFFVANPDAATARAKIKALTKVEAWKPVADLDLTERRRNWFGQRFRRRLYPYTLNGHLVPFFSRWGNRVVVSPSNRGQLDVIWGASQITYLNSTREKGYTVRKSKLRFLVLSVRLAYTCARFLIGYGKLRAQYRLRYPEITTKAYWKTALNLSAQPTAGRVQTDQPTLVLRQVNRAPEPAPGSKARAAAE